MTEPHEARRVCLTNDPEVAAELFQRQGLDPHSLERLLFATADAGEACRAETVELQDAWGRSTKTALYVPPSQGNRPRGVIVGLHGVGGSGAELEPYLRPFARACGAVLLCPTARQPVAERNNFDLAGLFGSRFREARWTTDPGDFPVRALRWAREHLAICVDRCALVGTSMGGIATWGIASRRWDSLAMVASINGAPSIWEMFGPDKAMRELLPNLLNLPFTVVHGNRDQQIPAVLDKEAVTELRSLGHQGISLVEVPEGEHKLSTMQIVPGNPQFDVVVQCFRSSRRTQWPEHVRHYAREGENGRAHWVAMDDLAPGRTAAVEARAVDRARLDVRAYGCSRMRLFLSDRLVDPGRVLVTVNNVPREIDFRPSMAEAVATYAEAGADPGRMAHMVVEVEIPEIHDEEGMFC
ncbi:hypothetical protein [Streptomyces sp. NPDC005407]|uniref:dienelactone hydrolase family protein n=1 Tax=Streptomyces sp. NPDC005407 TaxID=3155340 RepID=UPI0033B95D51